MMSKELLVVCAGAWVPSDVVEVVTRFARRLNKDVVWGDIEQLLVLVNQVACLSLILALLLCLFSTCPSV